MRGAGPAPAARGAGAAPAGMKGCRPAPVGMRGARPGPVEGGLPAAAAFAVAVALALGGALLLAAGCGRGDERSAIQDRLRTRGAAEVVREAAAARFTPPADGRLTDAQVRMYLTVRERESRIREAAALEAQRRREAAAGAERPERAGKAERAGRADRQAGRDRAERREEPDLRRQGAAAARAAPDDAALGAVADLRAAQELRVNPKEYAWVRARVIEAETAAATQALYQKMALGREQLLARMRRERDALADPAARAAAEREIEDWKRGLEAAEPVLAPAVRANVALLARYREPLARLRASEERGLAAAAGLEAPAGGVAAAVR
jgi:hypothetical protein